MRVAASLALTLRLLTRYTAFNICDGYVTQYSCRTTVLLYHSARVDQEIIPTASTQVHAVSTLLALATGIIFRVLYLAEYFMCTHRPSETANLR